jgi:hypothetical protein
MKSVPKVAFIIVEVRYGHGKEIGNKPNRIAFLFGNLFRFVSGRLASIRKYPMRFGVSVNVAEEENVTKYVLDAKDLLFDCSD